MANEHIKQSAKDSGVWLWEVADQLNLSEGTFLRQLRHELPEAREELVLNAIQEVAARKAGDNT